MSDERYGFARWMVERNVEYARSEGVDVVVARLRASGYNDTADGVETAFRSGDAHVSWLRENLPGALSTAEAAAARADKRNVSALKNVEQSLRNALAYLDRVGPA